VHVLASVRISDTPKSQMCPRAPLIGNRCLYTCTLQAFACGVRIADEPMLGTLCRRRQQRRVARHDAVSKVLTTRLSMTVVEEPPAPTATLPGARAAESVGEGAQVAHSRRSRVPRHQVSGGQAVHARQSRSVCEGR
jgi:hypothetical protein